MRLESTYAPLTYSKGSRGDKQKSVLSQVNTPNPNNSTTNKVASLINNSQNNKSWIRRLI